ncbi:CHAP domain-containing protein [Cohnella cellulosilytica]
MIMSIPSEIRKQESCVQLHGVSAFAAMLATKRQLDRELAAIAGMLHNYYFYKTGIPDFPGPNSSEAVRPLLRDMNILSKEEQTTLLRAIFHQGDRSSIHGPCEELVKDACLLHFYFQNSASSAAPQDVARLRNVLHELAIPMDMPGEKYSSGDVENRPDTDRRSKLADMAETLAGLNIAGVPGDQRYREICKHWPDAAVYKELQNSWCAAFVYHCCWRAGFQLPIRYPNGIYRLAGVGAWLEWAQLPETGFLYYDGHDGFAPQRGDIVIYEKLLSNDPHDHIGIVLACDDQEITVAEGNRDNRNDSGVVHRERGCCILGYIRIDNNYAFGFSGEYNPIL